jgi:phage baseplate assembly protein W
MATADSIGTSTANSLGQQVRGMSFPFRIDARTGGVAISAGAGKLRENITHLLLTRIGERAMLREYGGGVTQLLQEGINEGVIAIAQHQIAKAILRYEPRILPQQVTLVEGDQGQLLLRVVFLDAEQQGLQQAIIPID